MAYGPHTFAYPAQLNWQEKIKTQRVASDAFNGRRAGAIGCRRKCRRGKPRECGNDWETGSLLLAFVDLPVFLLSLLLLLSLYPLPLPSLLLLLPMLSLIIPLHLLFLLLLILLLLLLSCMSYLSSFPYSFCIACFAALSATLGLPASPTLLLPQLPLLSTSPTPSLSHYTISRLHFLPVMRVLQQPRSRPLITKALTTCCRHQPTRLDSRSVSQSSSHARQLCVAAHANVANGVADCIIAVGSRQQQQQQLATLATAQLAFKAAKVFVSVHFNLPVERSTKSNANQIDAKWRHWPYRVNYWLLAISMSIGCTSVSSGCIVCGRQCCQISIMSMS